MNQRTPTTSHLYRDESAGVGASQDKVEALPCRDHFVSGLACSAVNPGSNPPPIADGHAREPRLADRDFGGRNPECRHAILSGRMGAAVCDRRKVQTGRAMYEVQLTTLRPLRHALVRRRPVDVRAGGYCPVRTDAVHRHTLPL